MPPVRWKLLTVMAISLLQMVFYSTDAQVRQGDIMTADGWRPILGTRKPNYYGSFSTDSDFYRYDILSTPPPTITALPPINTAGPSPKAFYRGSPKPSYPPGRKVPHQKQNPYYALPTLDTRGPHVPLGAVVHTRPSQIGHIKQHATSSKPFIHVSPTSNPFIHVSPSSKRNVKPARIQTSTIGYRDDIFTASASSGTYSLFKQNPSNIRTRETIDLGIPGTNHYSINQPHAHIEFTNRFAPPVNNENVYQQYNNNPPIPAFLYRKHPQGNEINYQVPNQNDEYTRNLIPPPQFYKNQDTAPQGLGKTNIDENVVLQVPPPFQFQKNNEPAPVQVQVTKEKLHEFHNIPANYHGQYIEYDFPSVRKPTEVPKSVYEVTEGKEWQEAPSQRPIRTRKPSTQQKRRPNFETDVPVFLPTPYRPETHSVEPTSPTQSEVSTIFNKLSKLQKQKEATTPNPFAFNVQEVSTHYPIFGKPIFGPPQTSEEISNHVTSHQEEVITTTKEPQRIRPHRRRKPESRRTTSPTTEAPIDDNSYAQENEPYTITEYVSPNRKKPSETSESTEYERPIRKRPSATFESTETERPVRKRPSETFEPTETERPIRKRPTETFESTETERPMRRRPSETFESTETERPIRKRPSETTESTETERPIRRRPQRYRTTTPSPSSEETPVKTHRGRNRYRHRNTEVINYEPVRKRIRPSWVETTTTMPENHKTSEEYYQQSESSSPENEEAASERSEEIEEPSKAETIESELPERHYVTDKTKHETIKPFIIITTTEKTPTTDVIIPENELDETFDVTSVANIEETTTTRAPPTTTTTAAVSHNRIRARPIKFDNSNRPRFSVKDYRQKLSQYSTTSAPEPHRTTSESSRLRLPNRLRRPMSLPTTINEEDSTEPIRSKFVPKEPRHSTTEDTTAPIITEKNVKSINTRLRPFGRYKSTTVATTITPKVSIKPNLFSRKRPPMLSLRGKIYNRLHKNNTETSTDKVAITTEENGETTLEYESEIDTESTTDSNWRKTKLNTEEALDVDTTTVSDLSQIDPFFYSQRVSDLTSSAKNDYNTPGLFKSVSPTSRRIPNYFTIATDDPILPIEAFFPDIKDKIRDKDS